MKFKDTELLPGVVINADDPKKLGRIKVTVPGLFDSSQMNVEGMPWVYPITMTGYQGFSKLLEGSKVWVFKQEGNYNEFWYIPMFEANADTREIIADYGEPEVVISRSGGDQSVYVYYTNKQGLMLKVGDATINIKGDGEILAQSAGGAVSIRGGKVYVGTADATEQGILGNKLDTVLGQLANDLISAGAKAAGQWTTTHLSQPLLDAGNNLNKGIGSNILCEHTLVS